MFSVPPLVSFGAASAAAARHPVAASAEPPASARNRLRLIRSEPVIRPPLPRKPMKLGDASSPGRLLTPLPQAWGSVHAPIPGRHMCRSPEGCMHPSEPPCGGGQHSLDIAGSVAKVRIPCKDRTADMTLSDIDRRHVSIPSACQPPRGRRPAADDRPRLGLDRLRRPGARLHRRHGRALVRQRRLRPPGDRRRAPREALRLGYYHAFSSMATDLPPRSPNG